MVDVPTTGDHLEPRAICKCRTVTGHPRIWLLPIRIRASISKSSLPRMSLRRPYHMSGGLGARVRVIRVVFIAD